MLLTKWNIRAIITYEQMIICLEVESMSERVELCQEHHEHPEVLAHVKLDLPDEEALYDLAELFKVFGDSTRVRILYALFESELCVCDIAELLNMSQSAISHQRRVRKQAWPVRSRREGKTIFYFLADDHVRTIIGQGMEHINE